MRTSVCGGLIDGSDITLSTLTGATLNEPRPPGKAGAGPAFASGTAAGLWSASASTGPSGARDRLAPPRARSVRR